MLVDISPDCRGTLKIGESQSGCPLIAALISQDRQGSKLHISNKTRPDRPSHISGFCIVDPESKSTCIRSIFASKVDWKLITVGPVHPRRDINGLISECSSWTFPCSRLFTTWQSFAGPKFYWQNGEWEERFSSSTTVTAEPLEWSLVCFLVRSMLTFSCKTCLINSENFKLSVSKFQVRWKFLSCHS